MNAARVPSVASAVLLGAVLARGGAAQCVGFEEQKLLASDRGQGDLFGFSVALDGSRTLVGVPYDDDPWLDMGSAWVYRLDGGRWVEEQKLTPSDAAREDVFGQAVSLSGTVAVVGKLGNFITGTDPGAAYVFRFDGATWVEEQKLTAADAAAADRFGFSVCAQGNVLVVGAVGVDAAGTDAGAVYVFRFDGTSWVQEQKLMASDGAAGDAFGTSVTLDGTLLGVGAPGVDDAGLDAGAAYLWRFDGTNWLEETKLLAPDGGAGDAFGTSVSASGDGIVTGTPGDDDRGLDAGAAYAFRREGTAWRLEQKLLASDGATPDGLGWAVSMSGTLAAVGAIFEGGGARTGAGATYLFRYDGAGWVEEHKLIASDGARYDNLGYGVALDGSTLVATAAGDDNETALSSGSAYVFTFAALGLDASAAVVQAGDPLTFTTCGGLPNALGLLALVGVDGSPTFQPIARARFDAQGGAAVTGMVPPGLAGLLLDFQSFGFFEPGKVGASKAVQVAFQ